MEPKSPSQGSAPSPGHMPPVWCPRAGWPAASRANAFAAGIVTGAPFLPSRLARPPTLARSAHHAFCHHQSRSSPVRFQCVQASPDGLVPESPGSSRGQATGSGPRAWSFLDEAAFHNGSSVAFFIERHRAYNIVPEPDQQRDGTLLPRLDYYRECNPAVSCLITIYHTNFIWMLQKILQGTCPEVRNKGVRRTPDNRVESAREGSGWGSVVDQ